MNLLKKKIKQKTSWTFDRDCFESLSKFGGLCHFKQLNFRIANCTMVTDTPSCLGEECILLWMKTREGDCFCRENNFVCKVSPSRW